MAKTTEQVEQKLRNATALHNKLWDVIEGLENKTIRTSEAKEEINAAGKLIGICTTQLQANAMGASVAVDLLEIREGTIQLKNQQQKRLNAM